MKTYLFSYGTLQKEKTQLDLFGRRLNGTADLLEGYAIAVVEIKDEKFLAKGEQSLQSTVIYSGNENDRIEGTVFEVTEEELLLADTYEPDGYKRAMVNLASGKQSWIYLLAE